MEVTNIDSNNLISTSFSDSKEKPRCMTSCITIHSHKKIVLCRTHFHNEIQIATLEFRVKNQLVRVYCRIHTCKDPRLG
jgi:hypothetical protein